MTDATQRRLQAYLNILQHGLVQLRNFAYSGNSDLCRIEADHLHNIPTLLYEDNEHRHEYYIRGERMLYIERLRALGAPELLEHAQVWYAGPWMTLADVAGAKLTAWDREVERNDSSKKSIHHQGIIQ